MYDLTMEFKPDQLDIIKLYFIAYPFAELCLFY